MPTIRKRNGRYQAQVRVTGSAPVSRTFMTKSEAVRWARMTEHEVETVGLSPKKERLETVTLGELLDRYRREILSKRKWWQREVSIIKNVNRHPLSKFQLHDLTEGDVARYRDDRLAIAKPATVVRELALLSNCIEISRREWKHAVTSNPFRMVKKPRINNLVERRISSDELRLIIDECNKSGKRSIANQFLFSLETGVRKGELLGIRWSHINYRDSTILIPITKNGFPRTIPLTPAAIKILEKVSIEASSDFVFDIKYGTLCSRWNRLIRRCGINDLRWHDSRHEAISRLFELGLGIPEVALVSGHRDTKVLMRYTHLRPADLSRKIAMLCQAKTSPSGEI
ncbi:site-specific integrase [Methylobacterium sp. WL8]|nr:site-specific integrase [Methylobacterium sp. WL8]